jgi:hypothetical protein
MKSNLVIDEARGAGVVGQYLKERLTPFDLSGFSERSFSEQISFVYRPMWNGLRPFPLARAALSYLAARVPVQVHLPTGDIVRLITYTNPVPACPPALTVDRSWLRKTNTDKFFPYKPNPAAITKANVYADEILRDLHRIDSNFYKTITPYLQLARSARLNNDRVCNMILYAWSLREQLPEPARWAAACVLHPTYAKDISNFLKAVGANGSLCGAGLVEADVLQGRATGSARLHDEAAHRVDLAYIKEHMLAEYDDNRLRSAVKRILKMEIQTVDGSYTVDYPTVEQHWDSRWQWAVNGSHSRYIDPIFRPGEEKHPNIDRYHRRAWLEEIENDPRLVWDGTTYVGASEKLENGKTRAIFACDTVTYLAFDHLLSSVEKRWRGRRVILNPGRGGHLGMAERVGQARNRAGISAMLDYDDFNSHHTIRAMQIVTEEVAILTGYDQTLTDKLVYSLDHQMIHVGDKEYGRAAGTLMSGHRGTTFFNSILNMAYLMIELGEDWLLDHPSLHVGDDVYLGLRDYAEAGFVVDTIMGSPLRMNPRKQSIGHVSTEFLRVASGARYSYAYLARAVAGAVSGNWVNEKILAPLDALTSMIGTARSIANRSGSPTAPLLLRSAVTRTFQHRWLDDALVDELLCGGVAVNNGPQFISGGTYRYVEIKARTIVDEFGYAPLKLHATHAYLSKCATPLERDILRHEGLSVEEDMKKSSYSKSLRFGSAYTETLDVSAIHSIPAVGSVSAESLLRTPKPRGLLLEYPLLVLVKNRLSESTVRLALAAVGGNPNTNQLDLDAWGEYRHGCIVNTVLSYTDASTLSKRTTCSVLTSTRKCFV